VGAYIQINSKTYLDFLADNYLNTPIFIIIAGKKSRASSTLSSLWTKKTYLYFRLLLQKPSNFFIFRYSLPSKFMHVLVLYRYIFVHVPASQRTGMLSGN
jgi:hypothetical protein